MGPFLAIVGDTWRQSKQQVVFLLLIGVMLLFSVAWVFLCRVQVTPDGTYVLTLAMGGSAESGFEVDWDGQYKEALSGEQARDGCGAPAGAAPGLRAHGARRRAAPARPREGGRPGGQAAARGGARRGPRRTSRARIGRSRRW
jgi:hypothetical protein